MKNQKAENLLNLAVSTPEAMRERTEELGVGFDTETRTWEMIVTYGGDLRSALEARYPSVTMRELIGGFAILRVPEGLVGPVLELPEIEYAEKPKRLYFAVNRARAASCLLPVQTGADGLTGRGVLIGIVDSGIDLFHDDFRTADGGTRIRYLYDQVLGRGFTKEEIDEALGEESRVGGLTEGLMGRPEERGDGRMEARARIPSIDSSGHGTAVAGIAAGNGRESDGQYRGVAYESELLVVRLGIADPDGFPRTTQVMEGLDLIVRTAEALGRPLAVNLSFGNTYGSHDGSGIFERYIDRLAERGRSVFVVGAGNEGDAAGHVQGDFRVDEEAVTGTGNPSVHTDRVIELSVAPYESSFSVQLWKNYEDTFEITLTNPPATITERISGRLGPYEIDMGSTIILVYYGEPGPFQTAQEIYFDFIPKGEFVESGIWKFTLRPTDIVQGRYDFWLPSAASLNRSTRFLRPSPETTLTIPSTATRPITVGAYDDATRIYAPFSGRGDLRTSGIQKPDLAAPGVGIIAPQRGGGYAPVTGTSFAAPFVTGAAALLMEWGIVRGNDPYLYGDKVKAYLRRGARELPGYAEYPNAEVGYGALCVRDSLPG